MHDGRVQGLRSAPLTLKDLTIRIAEQMVSVLPTKIIKDL